jgi:hypothetical protein
MNCFANDWRPEVPDSSRIQAEYRGTLESYLIPVPRGRRIDFRSVALSADAVHKRTSGQVSSRSFLLMRHSALNGRTPIEVMAEPDGPDRIRRLVDTVSSSSF